MGPPPIPNIAIIAGPPLIGINLNSLFYGALVVQYYMYCIRYKDDKLWIKLLVHFLFALETAQTAMSLADGFYWFVSGYGNMTQLSSLHLANIDSPLMSAIIGFTSHGAYCWRIWYISRCYKTCIVIILATCVQLTGGIGASVIGIQVGVLEAWNWKSKLFSILWGTGSATADIIIALILTIGVLKKKGESSFGPVDNSLLARIVRLCIETNAMTAFVAIIDVIFIVTPGLSPPVKSYFSCPGYILGKLYSNSFMTMLNNREVTDCTDAFVQRTTANFQWPAAPIIVDTVVLSDEESQKAQNEDVCGCREVV